MQQKKYLIFEALVMVCIIIFGLVYTRPQTIEKRYSYLDLSQCRGIEGYYSEGSAVEQVPFSIEPEDPRFSELVEIIRSTGFRTEIRNLLPQGSKTHRITEGDYTWDLEFCFDGLALPDGSTSSGSVLSFQYFFGDLTSIANGKIVLCTVTDEDEWAQRIMDIITDTGIQEG